MNDIAKAQLKQKWGTMQRVLSSLEGAVEDYTSGAMDGYDKEDVKGLVENRLDKAREDLEECRLTSSPAMCVWPICI